MRKPKLDFEEEWRRYINGDPDLEPTHLLRCLKAAATLDQVCQVFAAASTSDKSIENVKSPALKKMVGLVTNIDEARRVLSLASQKNRRQKPHYPLRIREAEAKLQSFLTAA